MKARFAKVLSCLKWGIGQAQEKDTSRLYRTLEVDEIGQGF